ncbi:MAG: phospholipase D-like domain-containing protein [Acidobacteria bacterium]|nr:phospholipase D-like domain-containing protein [Acidobacteriota bacterium]MCI0719719.1 phospholipase D-like domain-containing protein [Acidobacteriota bacterium]
MKLLIQPGDGSTPLVEAINRAVKSIEIVIFRFNRREIEAALKAAAARGVFVHALVTYRNRGGEKNLRKLEMRLLEAGVTVARTSNDLLRYHDKFMIVDRQTLFLLAFNFTALDIDHSRTFGLTLEDPHFVDEAAGLFEADYMRQPFNSRLDALVVSPINARKQLAGFIERARQELLIYDPKISDPQMIRLLKQQSSKGLDLRVIGRIAKPGASLPVRKLGMRLHCRAMVRDRQDVFIGSQSLRAAELDERREVGIIVSDAAVADKLRSTFEADWVSVQPKAAPEQAENRLASSKVVKKAVKALVKEMPPLSKVVKEAVQQAVETPGSTLNSEEVKETVKEAVREAVKEGVKQAVKDAVEERDEPV